MNGSIVNRKAVCNHGRDHHVKNGGGRVLRVRLFTDDGIGVTLKSLPYSRRMGGGFLKLLTWYIIGILCGYEVITLFAGIDDLVSLGELILEPGSFLTGAVFLVASFMILSHVVQKGFILYLCQPKFKRRTSLIISLMALVVGWGFLFVQSFWLTLAIAVLTSIHFSFSYGKIRKELSEFQQEAHH